MTRIFITIPWFLPAFRAGGPIQSIANLVKEYEGGAEFYIFCGDADLTGGALENIITGEWIDYNHQTKIWYAIPDKLSETLDKQVEVIKPGILYIIGIFSWHFNMVPLLFCKAPKKILSVRGMLHPGALSQKKWKKKIYLEVFKLLGLPQRITFHVTDEEEEKFIDNNFGQSVSICIAGNFPNKTGRLPLAAKIHDNLKMVSIAVISPMKNILVVLKALENMEAKVQYDIYGPVKDRDYNDQCLELVKSLPANITVVMHGEVEPEKVKNVLMQAHIFVLPSKSENFGHALYEALSAGRPVITSHFTPWNNLTEAHAGINVSLENNEELLSAISIFASMDEGALAAWSLGASAYAEKAVDIEKIRKQYEDMFLLPDPGS